MWSDRTRPLQSVAGFTGGGQTNSGFMFVSLKSLSERKDSADRVMARLRPKLARNPARAYFCSRYRISGSADAHPAPCISIPCRPKISPN